jgi:hypothetical protein
VVKRGGRVGLRQADGPHESVERDELAGLVGRRGVEALLQRDDRDVVGAVLEFDFMNRFRS